MAICSFGYMVCFMKTSIKIHPLPQEYLYRHFPALKPNPEPEPIVIIKNNRIPVSQNGLYGFLDSYGKEIVPCAYHSITRFQNEASLVEVAYDKYSYVRWNGDLIPGIYDSAEPINSKRWAKVRIDESFGTVGIHGIKETCRFDEIDGHMIRTGNKWGLLNEDGYVGVPCIYDELGEHSGNAVPVRQGLLWGILHNSGKIIVAPIYDCVEYLEQFYFVRKGNVGALYTPNGGFLIEEEGLTADNYSKRLLTKNKTIFGADTPDGYAILRLIEQNGVERWNVIENGTIILLDDTDWMNPHDYYEVIKEPATLRQETELTDNVQPYLEQEKYEDYGHFLYGLEDEFGVCVLPTEYRWMRAAEGSGPMGYTAWKDGTWYFIEIEVEF